ncbi:MAG TPA: aminotransferase class V-fold PLP-dependent enzyme, partial [Thermodesulfobacteriota bacterium]|nr:aminotransferase class V-fold PLP-dependent enzyme [Thermodesulfobacteriota bacterium]
VSLRVIAEVERFLGEAARKAVMHYERWMERVEAVRGMSARLIGAAKDEIAFIKNTSHGISIVTSGLDWRKGDNVVVFEKEFPSNIFPWLDLKRKGVEVRFIPYKGDRIGLGDIEDLIDRKTRLVTMSSVQSLNGFMIDLGELGKLCRSKGVLLFVDAIQSLGVVPMDVKEAGADFLAADGHKWMLAPEGTGIFYCRKGLAPELRPSLIGWKSVKSEYDYENPDFTLKENALRFEEGSYNVMGIRALGAALELLFEIGIDSIRSRVLDLGDLIMHEAGNRGFRVRTPGDRKERGGIVSFSGDFDPVVLRKKLGESNIVVNNRGEALRIAPHFYNREDEILRLFQEIDRRLSKA